MQDRVSGPVRQAGNERRTGRRSGVSAGFHPTLPGTSRMPRPTSGVSGGGNHLPVGADIIRPRFARGMLRPSVGATCGRPPGEAPASGGPHFFPKKWGERRAGGLRPPWAPQYGGSWRRCAVRAGQRPTAHCRPFFRWFHYRRCRASGSTHRDCPANPDGCCAVPGAPAGPPPVPCL